MIGLSTKLFILKKQPRNISHSSVPTFIYVLLKEKKQIKNKTKQTNKCKNKHQTYKKQTNKEITTKNKT